MKRNVYLTACLMSYYQQKKLYLAQENEYAPFNIENPLFVFVGASVNAVRTENKRKVSDVVDILMFFRDFITNTAVSTASPATQACLITETGTSSETTSRI